MAKGKKSKGNSTTSSGLSKIHKANQAIVRLKMKIKRWERYKAEGKEGWDTKGLLKDLMVREEIASKG